MKLTLTAITLALVLATPLQALAQNPTATLSATASSDVDNDEMVVVLRAVQEGPSASALTQNVLSQIQKGVAKAKAVPGLVVRTGNVSTNQVWGPQGRTGNWSVQADVTLTSRNFQSLADLAGKLSADLQISQVTYSLSRDARLAEEQKLISQVADEFKKKAQSITQAFGFKGYKIQSLNFTSENIPSPRPMLAMASMKGGAERASLTTEGGKSTVSLQISGVVEHDR